MATKKSTEETKPKRAKKSEAAVSADIAAISMALYMYYEEAHDTESNVITIKRIERRYSPWSSKIYGIINQLK